MSRARGSLLAALGFFAACGARDGLTSGLPAPPPPDCYVDEDCPTWGDLCNPVTCVAIVDGGDAGVSGGHCVMGTPVNCDDGDPCTTDTCDSDTGECSYAPATLDLDGDGYRAPRPGYAPGSPGSCGDDCDDTNPNAHPGAKEVCDGVDNDCNGIVDDNATYIPLDSDGHRIDGDIAPAGPGGVAWSGDSYLTSYWGTSNGFDVYTQLLGADGTSLPPGEAQFTLDNADADGGPVVWIGDRYGMAWQDRRDGDYEIYFSILGKNGAKAIPDTRMTNAYGFSINVALGWNGTEFLAVWQDDRNISGIFDVYGQRIDVNGNAIGDNIQLTDNEEGNEGFGSEWPQVAIGTKGAAVSWSEGDATTHMVQMQVYSPDLSQPIGPTVQLTDGTTDAVYPTITFSKDRYVVAWYDTSATPAAIYGAAVGEDGTILTPATPLSNPGPYHSRYPFMRPLGDRLLVVYSDDRDQNQGYEIYSRMISAADLSPLSMEQRLTFAPQDSIEPVAAFGPQGNVGILFRDDRENGEHHVYFTRMQCIAGAMMP